MAYRADIHNRRSIRLAGFDYASRGAYFVTICTHERELLFDDGRLRAMAAEVWRLIMACDDGASDEFVVIMPNHVHGIVWLGGSGRVGAQQHLRNVGTPSNVSSLTPRIAYSDRPVAAPLRVAPGSLAALVRAFKSATAKRINNIRGTPGAPVWQRNYHEHIIRSDADLNRIRQYIRDNPARWEDDPDNPCNRRCG